MISRQVWCLFRAGGFDYKAPVQGDDGLALWDEANRERETLRKQVQKLKEDLRATVGALHEATGRIEKQEGEHRLARTKQDQKSKEDLRATMDALHEATGRIERQEEEHRLVRQKATQMERGLSRRLFWSSAGSRPTSWARA